MEVSVKVDTMCYLYDHKNGQNSTHFLSNKLDGQLCNDEGNRTEQKQGL
jgi:hypothetical protein